MHQHARLHMISVCCLRQRCVFAGTCGTKFARVESTFLSASALQHHEKSQEHQAAVKTFHETVASDEVPKTSLEGLAMTGGHVEGVPRLDRWLHAASLIERYDSFEDLQRSVATAAVGSMLEQGGAVGDTSRKVATQLVTCLAEPLRWRDFEILANSTCSSIGLDECDSVLLLYARCYVRRTQEIYDCMLGLVRGHGTLPEHCKSGIVEVMRKACTVRQWKQVGSQALEDHMKCAEGVYERFRKSVITVVADGGVTEQRALFECSPIAPDAANRADPVFPNLVDISRDRAHKWRSIQKGIWKGIDDDVRLFLDELVTGEGSFARMLQTSRKFRILFQAT